MVPEAQPLVILILIERIEMLGVVVDAAGRRTIAMTVGQIGHFGLSKIAAAQNRRTARTLWGSLLWDVLSNGCFRPPSATDDDVMCRHFRKP